MLGCVKKFFSPELMNRIDECVYFKPLNVQTLSKIAENKLGQMSLNCKERGIALSFSSRVVPVILKKAADKKGAVGARSVLKIISNDIKSVIGDEILKGDASEIKLTVSDGEFKIINTKKALRENAV